MALKATIFKAELVINDMDRHRVLAFATHANEHLAFGKGVSNDDEPDLWVKDLTGTIEHWIDLGQPTEKRINKACGAAREVVVINYGGASGYIWWQKNQENLARYSNLRVLSVAPEKSNALAQLASRNMQLQCSIQDETAWISSNDQSVELAYEKRK